MAQDDSQSIESSFFMVKEPAVSFVTPIYNEEGIIAEMLANLHDVISKHPEWNAEVILVEDGSKDGTRAILEKEAPKYPEMQLILHETNLGYTPSLKDGLAKAQGRYIMYIGADEEFDCSEIPNFVKLLLAKGEDHADIVLGVRWQRNAYKLHRFFMSVIYIFFLNGLGFSLVATLLPEFIAPITQGILGSQNT